MFPDINIFVSILVYVVYSLVIDLPHFGQRKFSDVLGKQTFLFYFTQIIFEHRALHENWESEGLFDLFGFMAYQPL